jgi:hypothetical protein
MRVFANWSAGIASGRLNPATQNRLWEVLSGPADHWQYNGSSTTDATTTTTTSARCWQLFPAEGDPPCWVSLSDGLMVPDDTTMSQLFADVPGVSFIHLPEKVEAFKQHPRGR